MTKEEWLLLKEGDIVIALSTYENVKKDSHFKIIESDKPNIIDDIYLDNDRHRRQAINIATGKKANISKYKLYKVVFVSTKNYNRINFLELE